MHSSICQADSARRKRDPNNAGYERRAASRLTLCDADQRPT